MEIRPMVMAVRHAAKLVEAPRCGDGVLAAVEECDDGNQRAGDGCAADCTVELNLHIPEERLRFSLWVCSR